MFRRIKVQVVPEEIFDSQSARHWYMCFKVMVWGLEEKINWGKGLECTDPCDGCERFVRGE